MPTWKEEFGDRKIGFLIRKFTERDDRNRLVETVRNTFRLRGLTIKDANENIFHQETWSNIKEFLENCSFGIVLIDNFGDSDSDFNPNVFLEIGYLLAKRRDVFILIQNQLVKKMPTDIKPFLYTEFDSQEIDSPILVTKINKWIDSTIKYNPGFLTIYLRGEIINLDLISELKEIALSISDCNIIESSKLSRPDQKDLEEKCIECDTSVKKIDFKTQTKVMADRFLNDFNNGFYHNVPFIKRNVLKIISNTIPLNDKVADGGEYHLFNNDKEALIYCTNIGIQGCQKEEDYANSLFLHERTNKLLEIEIVVLPKFGEKNTYLYISNYYHDEKRYCVKMCHHPKDQTRIVLPLTAMEILFVIITNTIPDPKIIKSNPDFRNMYLEIVDLHIDKVKYHIENKVPIEMGLAKGIIYFDSPF